MTITKVRDHTRGIFRAEYSWQLFAPAQLCAGTFTKRGNLYRHEWTVHRRGHSLLVHKRNIHGRIFIEIILKMF
jgi:hypothetical protein